MKLHLHARKFINSWMCAHSLMHLCLHMHGAIFEQMELLLGLFWNSGTTHGTKLQTIKT